MNNKLTLFLPSLRGGGAERVMVNLARGFVERGLQVDLVLAKAEGPYLSQVPQSVRVVDWKCAPREEPPGVLTVDVVIRDGSAEEGGG